jgi:hypothetical protein
MDFGRGFDSRRLHQLICNERSTQLTLDHRVPAFAIAHRGTLPIIFLRFSDLEVWQGAESLFARFTGWT